MSDKPIVNGMWLGNSVLGPMEELTLKSFADHGAEFHLWNYGNIRSKVPRGVILRDGNEIIPSDKIFKYPAKMLLGFGGGSYVGFSELFRYKVLHDIGGWWSDMDVVCLKPLQEVTDDYWFRFHGVLSVVGNIMKCPPKSDLMKMCYSKAVKEVNDRQTDWHLAIRILCFYIELLGLSEFVHNDQCNLDRLEHVNPLIWSVADNNTVPSKWRFIHWMNSVISKNYATGSVIDHLYKRHLVNERTLLI